jgi:hypothetical protein
VGAEIQSTARIRQLPRLDRRSRKHIIQSVCDRCRSRGRRRPIFAQADNKSVIGSFSDAVTRRSVSNMYPAGLLLQPNDPRL